MPDAATWPAEARQSRRTLVLYDTTGRWGWLGELYATMTANLVGHFGPSRAKPVAEYRAGDMNDSAATIYIGSTYGERLPRHFLADVLAARRPVLWLNANIWQLAMRPASPSATGGARQVRPIAVAACATAGRR